MPNISVCIIAKNEEKRIERLLKSLLPYNFEIVVVDTGSTDCTLEVVSQYTSSVYSYEWCNNFSKARNFSLQQAKNDWILMMDSDEWISSLDTEELAYFMRNLPDSVGAINRHNKIGTPDQPKYSTDRTERFFNRKKYEYQGMIHEQLTPRNGLPMDCLLLNSTIEHDGYCMTPQQRQEKGKRNLTMLLAQLEGEGPSPYLFYQLGKACKILHDYPNELSYYEKALHYELDYSLAYVQSLFIAYLDTLLLLNKIPEAVTTLQTHPILTDSADYYYSAGRIYFAAKEYESAMDSFLNATKFSFANREGANSYLSYFELGKILLLINEVDTARSLLLRCGEYPPAIALLKQL